MAEVMSLMLRRRPRQVFNIFVSWNLKALWRRIKKFQRPWAPYNTPLKRELPVDTETQVEIHTEEYLRQTNGEWGINPYEPEIVALAISLGMKSKDKRHYAEDVYCWVKNSINTYMEIPPRGTVDVLKKGYGLCMSKMAVFAALARLAAIPVRFVSYKQEMAGGFFSIVADEVIGEDMLQEIQKSKPTFAHGCVEILLEGEWIACDLTWTDEEEAGFDMPITQFGESPFGKWYNIVPDTVKRSETISMPDFRFKMSFGMLLLRGLYDKVNNRFNRVREMGSKKLEEMGREAYITRKKKFYVPPPPLIYEE